MIEPSYEIKPNDEGCFDLLAGGIWIKSRTKTELEEYLDLVTTADK